MSNKHVLIINNEKYDNEPGWAHKIEEAIKKVEKVTCTTSHYSKIDSSFINKLGPQYIILTGRIGQHWEENEITEDYIPVLSTLKSFHIPTLGICAGMQLISIMYGGSIGKMIETEKDILEEGYVEHFKKAENKLLQGLNSSFYCKQFHRDEVKKLPNEFTLLASSNNCQVQAIAHINLPTFGVQFHPEWFNEEFPDGKKIFRNFLSVKN